MKERGRLTVAQEAELAELQTKVAQQKQKRKERDAKYYQGRKVAVARVAELEALKERGPLAEGQEVELAELRARVAGRGREKKGRDVTETGVGGAPVVGWGVGSEGVSGWAGADQDGREGGRLMLIWMRGLLGWCRMKRGYRCRRGRDAGVMLDAGAYEEFVETELLAFLGQDLRRRCCGCGGVGSVAGGFDFADFLSDYAEGEGSVGLFGGDGADGLFFGEPFAEDAVGPDAVGSGVWGFQVR